jgi:hypothetical protein
MSHGHFNLTTPTVSACRGFAFHLIIVVQTIRYKIYSPVGGCGQQRDVVASLIIAVVPVQLHSCERSSSTSRLCDAYEYLNCTLEDLERMIPIVDRS